MKKLLPLFLVFSFSACGWQESDQRVSRLTSDLISLRSVEPDANSPEYHRIVNKFAVDINELYPNAFVTQRLAIAFTTVLAGKDLSEQQLVPLISGVLAGFDTAAGCDYNICYLLESPDYRASVEQTYFALKAIGARTSEAQTITRLLYEAADRVANPLFRPIPPAKDHFR